MSTHTSHSSSAAAASPSVLPSLPASSDATVTSTAPVAVSTQPPSSSSSSPSLVPPRPGFAPILPCNDLDASERFYNLFGFTRPADQGFADYRMLTDGEGRVGGGSLHLQPSVPGWLQADRNPFGLYLYCADVDGLCDRVRAGGVRILGSSGRAEHKEWHMYEFAVSDPDQTLVRVGWPSQIVRDKEAEAAAAACAATATPQ